MPANSPIRLALSGRSPRRLPFERRLRLWIVAFTLPTLALAVTVVYSHTHSRLLALLTLLPLSLVALLAGTALFDQVMRPLQTLSNVVAALREDDFSFRARGARRGDALGDLALEINALAGTLQHQRSAALDALTLVERVLTSMPSPVLAFDPQARLRLLNPAAAEAFRLTERHSLGRTAPELHLRSLLELPDQELYTPEAASQGSPQPAAAGSTAPQPPTPANLGETASPRSQEQPTSSAFAPAGPHPHPTATRWSVRRTTFRLHGVPHTLFVLTDVSSALREEERLAWQRLIRVLGHEINNSLTPIKSIAGSLRTRLQTPLHDIPPQPRPDPGVPPTAHPSPAHPELDRGLAIIEDRADSLNRFLQAYQRLSRLPVPALRPTALAPLAHVVAALETRLPVQLLPSPNLTLLADPDQLQQLLINLIRNAVDAALAPPVPSSLLPPSQPTHHPEVALSWSATPATAVIEILDNGPGLTNPANLFVPFYTTKLGGSGIGLVLAQQITSAHRGTLTLTNRPNQPGCQAEIRLPLFTP